MSGKACWWQAVLCSAVLFVACTNDDTKAVNPPAPPRGGASGQTSGTAGAAPAAGGSSSTPEGGVPPSEGPAAAAGIGGDGGAAGDGGAGEAEFELHAGPYPPSPYPPENPDSDAKAWLGKILFWDQQLGGDDTVACGTCHRPSAGGSDPRSATLAAALPGPDSVLGTADDVHGSLGVRRCNAGGEHIGQSVQVTSRKAPTYLDAMLPGRLFWDGRAQCAKAGCPSFSAFEDPDAPGTFPIQFGGALENQAVGPPLSPVEMACEGATWPRIHQKLAQARPLALAREIPQDLADFIAANQSSYPKLFQAAFGSTQTSGAGDEINTRRIAFALATHERRLRSDQTPWDRWNAGDDSALSPGQLRGLAVFTNKARCKLCHDAPYFSDAAFHFIGFHQPGWDLGRNSIDAAFGVRGAFRTPTLRNVGLREATGLLHNGAGVGASLAEIIELYDQGGRIMDDLVADVPIDPTIRALHLTASEKLDLLDFLQHGLNDPRAAAESAPFDRPLLSNE